MVAPNVLTIADAVATAYGATTPPSGYPAIRRATARPTNAIPTYPFVTVMVENGEILVEGVGGTFTLTAQVRFWYAKHVGDQARDLAALLAWLGPLIMTSVTTASSGAAAAGQGVKSALGAEIRFFVDSYAGVESYGWEFDHPIIIRNWPLS